MKETQVFYGLLQVTLSARFSRIFSYVLNDSLAAAEAFATDDTTSLF
jgi:hypothetical protein